MDNPNITLEEYIELEAKKARRRETCFPSIVYKDALASDHEISSEPTMSPHHDNRVDFDFKISFDESDDEDYTVDENFETYHNIHGLDVPTRKILDSKGARILSRKLSVCMQRKASLQDMDDYSQKLHNGTSNRCISTETSDGLAVIQAQLNNLGREIKKVNEKVILHSFFVTFHTTGGQYRATTLGFYQRNNGNPSYQERRQTIEESLSKFMAKFAKRHEENSNLIKEIRASTDVAIKNQGASIKALEFKIRQMSKLRRHQVDDLVPTIKEGEVVDEPMMDIVKTRCDNEIVDGDVVLLYAAIAKGGTHDELKEYFAPIPKLKGYLTKKSWNLGSRIHQGMKVGRTVTVEM
ncbi:hypothetical protein Tco_0221111 [Tanacetum coccineum]